MGNIIQDEFTGMNASKAYYQRHKQKCSERSRLWRLENPELARAKDKTSREKQDPAKRRAIRQRYRNKNPKRVLIEGARIRAKDENCFCPLTLEEIVVPEFCPITGLQLKYNHGKKRAADHSPSLDRIDPRLGYTKENVRVISYKANRWKNNMSRKDIQTLLDYIDGKI